MIYGMPTLIEFDNLEENMLLCKRLGLQFVELNMNLPQYQLNNLENINDLKRLKERFELFYTIHLDENLNISDFNPLIASAYMKTVERAISVAKKLDIPILNMHMNHGIYVTLPDKKVRLFERYKETYMDSMVKFRELCEKAIDHADISICIENTDGFLSYEREAIELLLQSNVFALTWDIGHSNSCGDVDEAFLMKHENRLKHFHIHDGIKESNHLTLGVGDIDLQQRLTIARNHQCRCVVETKTADSLEKSVKWLKELTLPEWY